MSDVLMNLLSKIEEREDRLKKLEEMIAQRSVWKGEDLSVRWPPIRGFDQQIGERRMLDEVRF